MDSLIASLILCSVCTSMVLGLGVAQPPGASPQQRPATIMGDVKLTHAQMAALKRGVDVGVGHRRHGYAATNDAFKPWPKAIIPYEIDCSLEFMPSALKAIKGAMAAWEAVTCLRFVKRTTETDHLHFFRDTHCWGNVGRIGGASRISVGDGCDYQHVMEHEIGHTIGFWHEQNRKDRDSYVKINWENIEEWVKYAFDLVNDTDSLGVPYDYASIMHYPWNAFSKNGQDTMVPLRHVDIQPYLGVSKSDAKQVSLMYNCPAVTMNRMLSGKTGLAVPMNNGVCFDEDKHCAGWVDAGHCKLSSYVRNHCRLGCLEPGCDIKASCVDTHRDCALWASWGHCVINESVMKACPVSCSPACKTIPSTSAPQTTPQATAAPPTHGPTVPVTAGPTVPTTPYTGTLPTTSSGSMRLGTGILCIDTDSRCAEWAQQGECTRNPGYMQRECKKSCQMTDCDQTVLRPPGACADPLGLAFDGSGYAIPDANMKAASHLAPGSNWEASARNARLYFIDDHDQKRIGAWCIGTWNDMRAGAHIEIDLGQMRKVRYIATQGRHKYFERVDKFKITYSSDGVNFEEYKENGKAREFDGNCDHFTPILNQFNVPIQARHIRLYPTSANYPCIRMEFYGC